MIKNFIDFQYGINESNEKFYKPISIIPKDKRILLDDKEIKRMKSSLSKIGYTYFIEQQDHLHLFASKEKTGYGIVITRLEDEYWVVQLPNMKALKMGVGRPFLSVNKIKYLCDQWDGVLELLKDSEKL